MAKYKVKVNTKKWDAMMKCIVAIGEYRAHAGVLAAQGGETVHNESKLTLLELAAIHEFGSPKAGIPERSFIRGTLDSAEAKASMAKLFADLARKVILGKMSAEKAARIIGAYMVTLIKTRILTGDGIPPPNAQSTIDRKGSSRPLVDTGQLVGAITYEVRKVRMRGADFSIKNKQQAASGGGGNFSQSVRAAARGRR